MCIISMDNNKYNVLLIIETTIKHFLDTYIYDILEMFCISLKYAFADLMFKFGGFLPHNAEVNFAQAFSRSRWYVLKLFFHSNLQSKLKEYTLLFIGFMIFWSIRFTKKKSSYTINQMSFTIYGSRI